ncbi:MAG: hypothetical protein RR817_08740 [Niameybacter sp.]
MSKYNKQVNMQLDNPITYEIMFDGDDKKKTPLICFGIPQDKSLYLKQRIQGVLPGSTLTFEEDYAHYFDNAYVVEYNYTKDSMLSLKIKDNNFLQSMLNLKNEIQKGEKILFQVKMTPISNLWKSFQDEKWDKIRAGKDVATKTNPLEKTFEVLNNAVNDVLSIVDEVMEYKPTGKEVRSEAKELGVNISNYSSASKGKKSNDGFNVEIKAYIVTSSKMAARTHATTIETAMRELEEDNRLAMGSVKRGYVKRGIGPKDLIPIGKMLMSSKELASVVNIPNQRLQREFKFDSVNTRQVSAPPECLDSKGGIRSGILEIHGEEKYTYFPKDKNFLAMPKFFFAGMGSGKTTALLNYSNDVLNTGQSLIDINFVNECEIAYALREMHPGHIVINLADENNLPSLMLPEIRILETDSISEKKKKAGNCANEIEYFINSITSSGTGNISTRMGQYLICAAKIVFIYNGMKIRTAFDILDDKGVRDLWIKKAIESGVYKEDDYEIRKLQSLDEDKSGKLVEGVIDRYSELMRHETFQRMLDSNDPQFDFIDIMDNNKSISICMPEREFTNKAIKDVIVTYLLCRLRLAMIGRDDKDKVVHVLIDEAHHLNKALKVISNSIAEPRKYGVAFCFCSHYFNQLGEELKEAVLNVGGHFVLLKGIGESVFNDLKSKIGDSWSYDDIKEMEDFNSFNMMWIRSQHYMFVTKMLPPLKDKHGQKYIK